MYPAHAGEFFPKYQTTPDVLHHRPLFLNYAHEIKSAQRKKNQNPSPQPCTKACRHNENYIFSSTVQAKHLSKKLLAATQTQA